MLTLTLLVVHVIAYHHLKRGDQELSNKKNVYQIWVIIKGVTSKLVIGHVLVSLVVVGSKNILFLLVLALLILHVIACPIGSTCDCNKLICL